MPGCQWVTDQPKTSKGHKSTFPQRNERSSLAPPGRQRFIEEQQRHHQQPRPLAKRKGSQFTELREEKAGGMQEILTQQHADLSAQERVAPPGLNPAQTTPLLCGLGQFLHLSEP